MEVTVKKLHKPAIVYIFRIAVCIVGVASVAKCWRQKPRNFAFASTFHLVIYRYHTASAAYDCSANDHVTYKSTNSGMLSLIKSNMKIVMYFDNNDILLRYLRHQKQQSRTYGFRQIQQLICGQVNVS